ncbi:MAG: UPF0182 family protein [Desulfobacteraceae bacterium]|nr:UPF0182 family protein [Desulfobacteraceae bacterium]
MQKLKRFLVISFIVVIVLCIVSAGLSFMLLDFFVDILWYDSLDLQSYFILRLIYRYVVFGVVGFIFFAVFFLNFGRASRYLGTSEEKKDGDMANIFRQGSWKFYTVISFIMAIVLAIPLFKEWESALLFAAGLVTDKAGITDPLFNNDITYYLFSFPVLKLIQKELLLTFSVLFVCIGMLYWFLARKDKKLGTGPKVHLTILFVLICLIQVWGFILQQYDLLYTNNHKMFFGPGFLEVRFDLWCIRLTNLFFILTALSGIMLFNKRKKNFGIMTAVFAVLMGGVIGAHKTSAIRDAFNYYYMGSNEARLEEPYIQNSIKSTLAAFDLADVETRKYDIKKTSDILSNPDIKQSLRNIPVWDIELLDVVYQHLQAPQDYYRFTGVDVDRYYVEDRYQQIYLDARELNIPPGETSDKATARDTWPNKHLKYTHGYGFVMTAAAQDGNENMTWYARDMPLKSDYGFDINQPNIYYGLAKYDYAIVPNKQREIAYPGEETNILDDYSGTGGVLLSPIKTGLFALHHKSWDIISTQDKISGKSRFLFRRNFRESIMRITPFFLLDSDSYLVVTPNGLFWIQDAYTFSDQYPYVELHNAKYNYIRNSVKIVVDAYNGNITYYVADTDDPIINAYKKIYPGLLKDLGEMPPELKPHLRYPKILFEAQMGIYAKYHQTEPKLFYEHGDNWDFALVTPKSLKSYYLTLNLLNPKKHEFLLMSPMSPEGGNNLRALAIAGCDDGENYGKIVVYSFPRGTQVDGPSRISAKIDRDTIISQELTLWDQRGSEVIRGRVILLPVGETILYIQPVYLRSEKGPSITELKQIIVGQGGVVAMDETLEGAIQQLEVKLKSQPAGDDAQADDGTQPAAPEPKPEPTPEPKEDKQETPPPANQQEEPSN